MDLVISEVSNNVDMLLLRSTCQGVTRCNYSLFHMFAFSKALSTKNLRNISINNLIVTIAEKLFQTMNILVHTDWLNCASLSSRLPPARRHTAARNHPLYQRKLLSYLFFFFFCLVGVFEGFCLNLKLCSVIINIVEVIVIPVCYKASRSLMVHARRDTCEGL